MSFAENEAREILQAAMAGHRYPVRRQGEIGVLYALGDGYFTAAFVRSNPKTAPHALDYDCISAVLYDGWLFG